MAAVPTRSVLWLRRDLRLHDHPALVEAATTTDEVVPLFVIDASLWTTSGGARREYLRHSLTALNASMDNNLVVRVGNPADVVPRVAREVGASAVHISADFAPYGSIRDAAVEKALDATGVLLQRTGSPYAVSPGRVRKADRTPYRVYTPYYRAWCEHGWRAPAELVPVSWVSGVASDTLTHSPTEALPLLPEAGERAALARWAEFRDDALEDYADRRDRPDLRATSHLSVHLKFGEIHPRTLLADLGSPHAKLPKSHEIFRKELAWREFYADVLHHEPQSAREYLRPEFAHMEYDAGPSAERKLALWQGGNTGFPIVDAGMRQLLAEGWMHNRVRMIVASFLVKDLHLEWQEGAAGSCVTWSTATSRRTPTAGSGPRVAAPMPLPTSGSSTPSPRACGTTPTASMCGATCPNSHTCADRRCTNRGKPPMDTSRATPSGSSTTRPSELKH